MSGAKQPESHHRDVPQEGLGSIFRVRKWGRFGDDLVLIQEGRVWVRALDQRWAHIDLSCVDHVGVELRNGITYIVLEHREPEPGSPKCGCREALWLPISNLAPKRYPELRSALLTVIHPDAFSRDASDELSLWRVATSRAQ